MSAQSLPTGVASLPYDAIEIGFDGRGGQLVGLGLVNGVLKVLTLGLYSFWAKTEVRRRIWSATRLNGEPLAYTGTGRELFLGFLIVFAVIVLPVMLGGVAVAVLFPGKEALGIYQSLLYVVFFLLLGNAIYRAQRYRLSRTHWRGIRGGLVGSPGRYGWTYFWTLAAPFAAILVVAGLTAWATGPAVGGTIMVAGLLAMLWVLPWRSNLLQGMITRDMRFGDQPLGYSGSAGPLYKRYLFAWLGNSLVFALAVAAAATFAVQSGLYAQWTELKIPPAPDQILSLAAIAIAALIASAVITSWYRASQMNHFARHTHFDRATFRGEATGPSLMWLVLSNWLLSILGIAAGFIIGVLLVWVFAPPIAADAATADDKSRIFLALLLVMPPLVITSTLTATIAQYRSARYFLSRLKLDGLVNLGAILQGREKVPARGEGLAQVFDIDAF